MPVYSQCQICVSTLPLNSTKRYLKAQPNSAALKTRSTSCLYSHCHSLVAPILSPPLPPTPWLMYILLVLNSNNSITCSQRYTTLPPNTHVSFQARRFDRTGKGGMLASYCLLRVVASTIIDQYPRPVLSVTLSFSAPAFLCFPFGKKKCREEIKTKKILDSSKPARCSGSISYQRREWRALHRPTEGLPYLWGVTNLVYMLAAVRPKSLKTATRTITRGSHGCNSRNS